MTKYLTPRMLLEAFETLSEEEKDFPMFFDPYQFGEMTGIKNTDDYLGFVDASQVTPVITVGKSEDEERGMIQVELFPRHGSHPNFVMLRDVKDTVYWFGEPSFMANAQKAGQEIACNNQDHVTGVYNEDKEDGES